jgi:uncharacterized glyoxalase superfamily protein PhnB
VPRVKNASVPAETVLPHIFYQDVGAAVQWLIRVFGFREHFRYGDPSAPQGAQIHLGDAWVMLGTTRSGRASPAQIGVQTQFVTVFVDDVDQHYRRTKAADVRIIEELNEHSTASASTWPRTWKVTIGCSRRM